MLFFRMRWKEILLFIVIAYIIFLLVTGLLPYLIYRPKEVTSEDPQWIKTTERAVLVDDINEAWQIRLDLIENAEETLDIAYYAFHGGESVPTFISYIYAAAERGVKVRLVLDGMAHGMWQYGDYIRAFQAHPNIEFAFYQPIDLIRPWTLQDRMHEKIIIADGKYSLTGGRNIGDKYFTYENIVNVSIDRDVMLMKTDNSVGLIEDIQDYYNVLWDKEETAVITDRKLTKRHENNAKAGHEELTYIYTDYAPDHTQTIDWSKRSYPITSGYLVTNSLHSTTKEPRVWHNMLKLASSAQESVFFQTPYAIPTKQMREEMRSAFNNDQDITMLTNSTNAANNLFAYAGYLNQRDDFVESDINIFEYQPGDSQLHAKSLIVDDSISAIGSFNLDSRSAILSTESMLVLNSPEFTAHFKDEISKRYISQSKLITEENKNVTQAPKNKQLLFKIFQPISKLLEALL